MSKTKIQVTLRASEYGTNLPTLTVSVPAGPNSHRTHNALLFRLAAEIEAATPNQERWSVQVETHESRLYLELVDADKRETDVAMKLLRQVVRAWGSAARHHLADLGRAVDAMKSAEPRLSELPGVYLEIDPTR